MKMKGWYRCTTCDEWYDPSSIDSVLIHEHPEPQSGLSRDVWLASKLPYQRWIDETIEGYKWNARVINEERLLSVAREAESLVDELPGNFAERAQSICDSICELMLDENKVRLTAKLDPNHN